MDVIQESHDNQQYFSEEEVKINNSQVQDQDLSPM